MLDLDMIQEFDLDKLRSVYFLGNTILALQVQIAYLLANCIQAELYRFDNKGRRHHQLFCHE